MIEKEHKVKLSVPIIIEKDGNEYHAYSPVLKGLHTCGETKEEALENAKNAISAYLFSLIKHGDPIPLRIIKENKRIRRNKVTYYPFVYDHKEIHPIS